MAKIIAFVPRIPAGKQVKWPPVNKRGTIIEFPKKLKTSA